ncbi:MAG: 50S ribosomal protein L29 [Candidatus Tectomicrobia bacterium]|uniref:Large ribosomal subunit protein uL29 n=1 Tax=Tectimicrobiota bacterium TaxID=2528274 RepID=A0A932MLI7_UNCTE|nr:50S ribosomal protein L29 [Candidatus Tectomicrobia bacterium]
MKFSQVHELSPEELAQKEGEIRKELFNLKFRKATGQLDNTARVRNLKRDLARVLTSQKQREAQAPAGGK